MARAATHPTGALAIVTPDLDFDGYCLNPSDQLAGLRTFTGAQLDSPSPASRPRTTQHRSSFYPAHVQTFAKAGILRSAALTTRVLVRPRGAGTTPPAVYAAVRDCQTVTLMSTGPDAVGDELRVAITCQSDSRVPCSRKPTSSSSKPPRPIRRRSA
jgi:hypothetical protein